MAQTTGGMSANAMYVGLSTDNSSWTDVSGYANSVVPGGGERKTGEAFTFDGDTPIIKAGKRGALEFTISGVYTEETNKFYAMAKAAYEAGSSLYARWSPGGGDSGDYGYTTSAGIVVNQPYPSGSSDNGDPILIEVTLRFATLTQSTIGTAGW